jgi:uncharacterized protein YeaO (DUF488 family)
MEIRLKRAYAAPARGDGFRILVDRLWPRGVSKVELKVDAWAKDLAPSTELRKWFAHDPQRWPEFRKRYRMELTDAKAFKRVRELLLKAGRPKMVTLVFGAKDEEHNDAVVLRELFKRAALRLR